MSLLEMQNIRLTLPSRAGPVDILRGIDLNIDEGEAVGIVGSSGSGKTSLLMLMGGLETATSGSVNCVGYDFTSLGEDELARIRGENIGIVFQSFHLVPTMTALENVALPLEFANDANAFDRAESALEEVGLGHRKDHFPAQLSGGEQQRVALARAIAPAPKLLLADEPTGNLDGETSAQVMNLIFDLKERKGATLVLVTHDQSLADRCSRVVKMENGRITQNMGASVPEPA